MSNWLWQGEAKAVCANLAGTERFNLVYLDPPYSVGATMTMREEAGQSRGRKTKRGGRAAYHDAASVDALVAELSETIARVRDCMADDAAIFVHMDYRAIHEMKVACDRIFGRSCFVGEIIWQPGNGARGARSFAVTHQNLLVYGRSGKKIVYNQNIPQMREPYAATSLKMHFRHTDSDGRLYRERKVNGKTYRYYADEGRRLGSVWNDIPAMVANTPLLREGTGYPTQKPLKLLERIVLGCSRPDDTVADLMCGSGTTLVAAALHGRRFVGADRSEVAIDVAKRRLSERAIAFEVGSVD